MRQANLFMMSAAMLLAACGGTKDAGKTDQVLIEKSDIKIEGKRMTPEALWAMGRIGGLAVSPDGKKIAYTVAYYSVPENKSNREVFVMNADGSDNRQITRTPQAETLKPHELAGNSPFPTYILNSLTPQSAANLQFHQGEEGELSLLRFRSNAPKNRR